MVLWQAKITGLLPASLALRKGPGALQILWYNRIFSLCSLAVFPS